MQLIAILVTLCGSGPHVSENATLTRHRTKHLYKQRAPYMEVARVLQNIPVDLPIQSSKVPPSRIVVATWSRRPTGLSLEAQQHYNKRYCTRHGYVCVTDSTRRLPHLRPHFEKLAMVEHLFLSGSYAVLLLDDDACVVRTDVPVQHYLDIFTGDSMILSSAGWQTFVPAPNGLGVLLRETWDVPQLASNPPGVQPSPYTPNTGAPRMSTDLSGPGNQMWVKLLYS